MNSTANIKDPRGDALEQYAACVYDPDDTVELRLLPDRTSDWCLASELPRQASLLETRNAARQNIYVGGNPRKQKGGTKAHDVAFARCLFCDWDDTSDPDEARRRWESVGLPEPTLLLFSGHGIHAYWRLAEPLLDLRRWSALQRALIAAVRSDKSIHDPPRIMRLPGFDNHKFDPSVPCEILQADANLRYPLAKIAGALQPVGDAATSKISTTATGDEANSLDVLARATAYITKMPSANEGERNTAAFRVATVLVNDYSLTTSDAKSLLERWNRQNSPPLGEVELQKVLANAHKHAKGPSGNKLIVTGSSREQESAWQELQPLELQALPPFPIESLPELLRDWASAEAIATQTPVDLASLLSVTTCSACVARHVVVEMQADWIEPTNLYSAVLLEPANRKSAVFGDATNPLREVEEELVELARPVVAKEASERRQAEGRLKHLEGIVAKGKPDEAAQAKSEAAELAQQLADWPEPVLPQLIVDDCTTEKLAMVLAEQGGRIASMSAEGDVFDLMAGRYSAKSGSNFGVHLKGHAGDTLRVARVSRPLVYVHRPAITLCLTMQPEVIRGLAHKEAFRGRGLLARFLYSAPESLIGYRDVNPPKMQPQVRRAYEAVVRTLAQLIPDQVRDGGFATLRPDPQAVGLLHDWAAEVERELAEGGHLEIMRDWGGKLVGATVRIAGVLHCVSHYQSRPWEIPLAAPTLAAAIEIGRYLIPHADAVLAKMAAGDADAELTVARHVWRAISRHRWSTFSRRDLHRVMQARFSQSEELELPLAVLVKRGYLRRLPDSDSKPGRNPSPVYEVHPDLRGSDADPPSERKQVTELTERPDAAGLAGNGQSSVNSVSAIRDSKLGEAIDAANEASEVMDAASDDWAEV